MTNKENTVTYHRADYVPGNEYYVWEVYFLESGEPCLFTAEEGEAMGLTVPEPAPLVVECRGHRIELSDHDARLYVQANQYAAPESVTEKFGGLLRDARQDPQPTVDTPSDDIDFDALPIGTVLRGKRTDSRYFVVKTNTSEWTWASDVGGPVWTAPIEWRVVYQPAALSPLDHLRALLGDRDDADELIDYAAEWWNYDPRSSATWGRLLVAIGDAARGGA